VLAKGKFPCFPRFGKRERTDVAYELIFTLPVGSSQDMSKMIFLFQCVVRFRLRLESLNPTRRVLGSRSLPFATLSPFQSPSPLKVSSAHGGPQADHLTTEGKGSVYMKGVWDGGNFSS